MKALWLAMVLGCAALAQPSVEIPRYPQTKPIQIGDELTIAGERFRISYFTTADSVRAVADYFFEKWKQMGLPAMVDGRPDEETIVSAFYTREGVQQAVVLRRRSGKTIGLATVRDLWFQAAAGEEAELFSPEQNVVWLEDVESRDTAARMRHRTALVESALSAAADVVKAQLTKRGYALLSEAVLGQGGRRQLRLEHAKGDRRLVTHLAEIDGGATAVVQTCLGCAGAAEGERLRATARPAP